MMTLAERVLAIATEFGNVTIAEIMEAELLTMTETYRLLSALEAEGKLDRNGGNPRKALFWSPTTCRTKR